MLRVARHRPSLRQGLDREVYQIVRKLEDEAEENGSDGALGYLDVSDIYNAIKKSNSSLSRQKRQVLEGSIERVLTFRKADAASDDAEERELQAAESAAAAARSQRDASLLNRQMTKHWNLAPPAEMDRGSSAKKRRLSSPAPSNPGPSAMPTGSGSGPGSGATTPKAQQANGVREEQAVTDTQLKKAKSSKAYDVQTIDEIPKLGGIDEIVSDMEHGLFRDMVDHRLESSTAGLLIAGPPGCGKSSLVRFLAAKWEAPLLSVSFDESQLASSEKLEKRLTSAYEEAKRLAPCVVLIDNLHRYLGNPSSPSQHERAAASHYIGAFLARFFENRDPQRPIAVIATTSQPEMIDRSLLTIEGFAKMYNMKIPDTAARKAILQALGESAGFPALDYAATAQRTHGYVARDFKYLIEEGSRVARRRLDWPDRWKASVTEEDLAQATTTYVPHLLTQGFSTIPSVTFGQVGGLSGITKELELSIIGPIKNPEVYRKIGITKPSGVLLWGPPGCGKTLVAQAVANAAQASFILVKGPELLDKYVGESERKIRELFMRARMCAPCLIFFDEMDSLVPRRENTSTEAGARVVNTFLAELDGGQDRSGVHIIATTNRPDMIDPAMLRPGRLDRSLFVDLPNEDERVDILSAIARSRGLTDMVDRTTLERIARDPRCNQFSGADLAHLFTTAAMNTVHRQVSTIEAEDWEAALEKTRGTVDNPEMYRKLAKSRGWMA